MNTPTKVGIAVAGLLAVGGVAQVTSGYTFDCSADWLVHCRGDCKLDVTVNSCTPADIVLSTETLSICDDRKIMWKLDGKDSATGKKYKFRSDGIHFDPADSAVFDPAEKDAKNYTYVWHDKHVSPGNGKKIPFKYTVNIVKDDGSACTSRDPRISNE